MSQATKPNTTTPSRRALLGGAPAVAAALATGTAVNGIATAMAAPSVDPIFAVIAEHRAAVKARSAALIATYGYDTTPEFNHIPENSPFWQDREDAHDEAFDREWTAFDALFATVPTTVAGVAALLYRLGSEPYSGDGNSAVEGDSSNISVLGWAEPADQSQLMHKLAITLRSLIGEA